VPRGIAAYGQYQPLICRDAVQTATGVRSWPGRLRRDLHAACALLALGISLSVIEPRVAAAQTVGGRVVDARSGEPLAGAVVVVITHRYPITHIAPNLPPREGPPQFVKAVESVTDAGGRFRIDTSTGVAPSEPHEQRAVVFKPGYRAYTKQARRAQGAPPLFASESLGLGKMTELREMTALRTRQDVGIPTGIADVPVESTPKLNRLLFLQQKLVAPIQAGGAWFH